MKAPQFPCSAARGYNCSMDPDEALISLISQASPTFVHVAAPNAYEAFRSGCPIFEVDSTCQLQRFYEANKAEFGDWIVGAPDSFRSLILPGAPNSKIYFTYHKHEAKDEFVKGLQAVERERPDLA